ncbi:MAG: caspase family protein [Bacteroidales bacterium]|nr:caspase family protein [Bacteroidales bacterium]MBD5236398.1 caspase family protein [Bacteroidales bacterium]
MNRFLLSILLCLFSCVCSYANVRVLSIGVSNYPETSGWNKLNAHNDVELMRSIFPDAILLENVSATRSGIEAQLKALALNAAKGDTVIIHFSGHGQQIITTNSADEIDGVDEAIVPYDAAKRKTSSYSGQNHLTDDAFGKAIDNIRKSVGPSGFVIALIDACHSDSMDKGTDNHKEIYRGTDEIFGAEKMSEEKISSLRDSYHNQDDTSLKASTDMSNVVYLSACRSDKRNYEVVVDDKGYGSLTYYFCEEYKNKGISDLSVFLSAIYYGMENNQTLKFHGQVPSIRNTIGWEAPSKIITLPPDPPIGAGGNIGDSSYQTIIWCIVAAVVIIIFIALWITRKRKK